MKFFNFKQNSFPLLMLFLLMFTFFFVPIGVNTRLLTSNISGLLNNCMLGVFVVLFSVNLLYELSKTDYRIRFFSIDSFLFLSLIFFTMASFNLRLADYATGVFAFFSLLYLFVKRKWYKFSWMFIFLFLYVSLRVFGTIGTPLGFRFPEKLLAFFIIPLSFCCFRLSVNDYFRLLKIFVRGVALYMVVSIFSWYLYSMIFGISPIEWMTKKIVEIGGQSSYVWITAWSRNTHPSFNMIGVAAALIATFYLYHNRALTGIIISRMEVVLFSLLSVVFSSAMESRIGIVSVGFILLFTSLYFVYIKTKHFKTGLIIVSVMFIVAFYLFENRFVGFINDNVRRTDYTLAVNYIKGHPMWGVGFGQQAVALKQQAVIMKDVLPMLPQAKTYTHNQFLGDMVQFGIWGLAMLLIFLTALVIFAFRSRSYPIQLFSGVLILYMFIEEPFTVQSGITRFMLFLTLFVHGYEIMKSSVNNPAKL